MFNWEDRMREEEAKHSKAFEAQRRAILGQKLEEQKRELLREVNQDQVRKMMA